MLVTLPNGIIEGIDHFNLVEVDELRGKQQNYLADKELVVGNVGHIPKILEDMILSVQTKQGVKWQGKVSEVINRFSSGDLETILIKIRENTYGPRFYHQAQCTHCDHINKGLRLDLDKLEIDFYPVEDLMKPKVLTLPKCNLEAELKPIFLQDLFNVIKITNSKHDTLITSMISVVLKRLGTNTKVTAADVDKLSMKDIMHLQEYMESVKLEGSIDTNVQVDCSNCKKEFEFKLNVFDPNFFAPTKESSSSST